MGTRVKDNHHQYFVSNYLNVEKVFLQAVFKYLKIFYVPLCFWFIQFV